MKVNVKLLSGVKREFEFEEENTTEDICKVIGDKVGMLPEQVKL
eukprot:CAMPEP_0176454162 /NCGR_PEP_ID=MMETSP0127-20121128/29774_1 /TAXON_ID=938130 /ORGANISM="Platyophrya macrostoma, Strain WH" /LENGTH=43 /DNA_ID= /DNA_START= /DNA_END= /DNA_ORIENTATION=